MLIIWVLKQELPDTRGIKSGNFNPLTKHWVYLGYLIDLVGRTGKISYFELKGKWIIETESGLKCPQIAFKNVIVII